MNICVYVYVLTRNIHPTGSDASAVTEEAWNTGMKQILPGCVLVQLVRVYTDLCVN